MVKFLAILRRYIFIAIVLKPHLALPESRQTPLLVSVEAGKVDVAELLILSGASVNTVSHPNVDTPLHLVKSVEMAQLLLDCGASLTAKNAWHQTPLHCACKSGDVELVKCFVCFGADLDAKDQQGRTALHCCAASNTVTTAECLIEAGCDIEAVDCEGFSALELAKLMAFHDVVKVISAHRRSPPPQPVFSAEK
jgi:ankyrin repeat protein